MIVIAISIGSGFFIGVDSLYFILVGQIISYFIVVVFPLAMTRRKRR